jgi:hypothetical protein
MGYGSYNNITGCRIENEFGAGYYCIYITYANRYNKFWNNIINCTNGSVDLKTSGENYTNYFNTTQTSGTNILGGSWIAGNWWSSYAGTDGNSDGIGDTPYIINQSLMIDYLPLTAGTFVPPATYSGTWTHIAVTYSKNTRQKKIYVNGELKRTETITGTTYKIYNNSLEFYIGKIYGITGNPLNGTIDEILITPRAKSKDEIMENYLNSLIYSDMPGQNEQRLVIIDGLNATEVTLSPIVKIGNAEVRCQETSKVEMPYCAA